MDINSFNKLLKEKIRKATLFEKKQDIKQAIKLWLEISEYTLTLSKSPELDLSFRTMLMNKAEQIIERVKELKGIKREESKYIEEKMEVIDEVADIGKEIPSDIQEGNLPSNTPKIINSNNKQSQDSSEFDAFDDKSLKSMPEGFKEVKTSQDFKILTPHDEEYVKKKLEQEVDMSIFKKKADPGELESIADPSQSNQHPSIELEVPSDESKIVCFACGKEQSSSNKECENCGISL